METYVFAEPVEGFFADVLPLGDDTPVDRRRVVAVVARGGVPFKQGRPRGTRAFARSDFLSQRVTRAFARSACLSPRVTRAFAARSAV